MAFVDDKDGERRRKSQSDDSEAYSAGNSPPRGKKRPPVPEVGNALRSAYEQAVKEDIPAEMLELLGKLG